MDLISLLKIRLRLSSSAFDEGELLPLVEACKKDLQVSGVGKADEDDPLIQQAIVLFVKAHFGNMDETGKFLKAYEGLRDSVALCGDYNEH